MKNLIRFAAAAAAAATTAHTRCLTVRRRQDERGGALVFAIVILAAMMVATVAASNIMISSMKNRELSARIKEDKWRARSAAANVTAPLRTLVPKKYDEDLTHARAWAAGRVLPAFDANESTAASSPTSSSPSPNNASSSATPTPPSRPIAVIAENGELTRSTHDLASATSLLGDLNLWAAERAKIAETYARGRGYTDAESRVVRLVEVERRLSGIGREPAYILEFTVDGRNGNYRVRPQGEVFLGPNDVACGTSVRVEANPSSVTAGGNSTLTMTYARAQRLQVKRASDSQIIFDQSVAEETSSAVSSFNLTPAATDTYTVEAMGAGAGQCRAVSAPVTVSVTQPPCAEITSFVANPANIAAGGAATLEWTTARATDVRINGTSVPASGTLTVSPTSSTVYTLTASGAGGSCPQTAQITVSVTDCPTIDLFEAVPPTITQGGQATLRWSVSNAGSGAVVTLDGTVVPASGSLVVTPATTTGYRLRVEGGQGCSPQERLVTVTVNPPQCAQITSLTASSAQVEVGNSVTLAWTVSNPANAAEVRLTGGGLNETVAPTGTRVVSFPTAGTYTFRLSVTSATANCSNDAREVTVTVVEPPPQPCGLAITSFTSDAACFLPGEAVTLGWDTANADTIEIESVANGLAMRGNFTVRPTATTTYRLRAGRAGCGSVERTVTVEAGAAAPVISTYDAAPRSIRTGESSTLTWDIAGATNATINGVAVNPASGSLAVSPNVGTDYVLSVSSGGCRSQTVTRVVRVEVGAACAVPRIESFTANPVQVIAGNQTTLSWTIANLDAGANVTLTGGGGVNRSGLGGTGTLAITPPATPGVYSYRLTAANPCDAARFVEALVSVEVVACPAPTVNSFTANPTSFAVGSRATFTLSWNTSDVSGGGVGVSIDRGVGGGLPASGSVDVTAPSAAGTYVYTLTATNACGASVTRQVSVTVTATTRSCRYQGAVSLLLPDGGTPCPSNNNFFITEQEPLTFVTYSSDFPFNNPGDNYRWEMGDSAGVIMRGSYNYPGITNTPGSTASEIRVTIPREPTTNLYFHIFGNRQSINSGQRCGGAFSATINNIACQN